MSSEVAVGSKHELSTSVAPRGAAENVDSDDRVASRISLMQPLSELVADGNAKPGEFRDSVDGRLLGTAKDGFEILVFDFFKTWVQVLKSGGDRGKYISTIPLTAENKGLELEEATSDGLIVRTRTFNYFCLVADKDVSIATPYVLSLSRTGLPAAKKINLFTSRMARMGLDSWAHCIKLTSTQEKNAQGIYHVPVAEFGRAATQEEKAAAEYWYEANRGTLRVHEPTSVNGVDEDDIPF